MRNGEVGPFIKLGDEVVVNYQSEYYSRSGETGTVITITDVGGEYWDYFNIEYDSDDIRRINFGSTLQRETAIVKPKKKARGARRRRKSG